MGTELSIKQGALPKSRPASARLRVSLSTLTSLRNGQQLGAKCKASACSLPSPSNDATAMVSEGGAYLSGRAPTGIFGVGENSMQVGRGVVRQRRYRSPSSPGTRRATSCRTLLQREDRTQVRSRKEGPHTPVVAEPVSVSRLSKARYQRAGLRVRACELASPH